MEHSGAETGEHSPNFCDRVLQQSRNQFQHRDYNNSLVFIPAPDFCNMRDPMFTGFPAMMQNLPFLKQRPGVMRLNRIGGNVVSERKSGV